MAAIIILHISPNAFEVHSYIPPGILLSICSDEKSLPQSAAHCISNAAYFIKYAPFPLCVRLDIQAPPFRVHSLSTAMDLDTDVCDMGFQPP